MSRLLNKVTAIAKIGYDKSTDYLSYYANYFNQERIKNEDTLGDYDDIVEVKNYEERMNKNRKRIFKHVGLINEYSSFFSHPTLIIDNIYLGSAYNAASYYTLKDLNIKVIINVTKEISLYYPNEFIYESYDLYDNNLESIYQHLEKAYQDIKRYQKTTNGNILIHCYMGASRSASVVLYYLMKEMKHKDGTNYSHDDAIKFLKKKRPVINPTFRLTMDLAKSIMVPTNIESNHQS